MEEFKEFTSRIEKTLNAYYGEDATITKQDVLKFNDQRLTGLSVRLESNIAPMIYLEPYYEAYKSGRDYDELIEDMIDVIDKHQDSAGLDNEDIASNLLDWKFCRERIYPILVSTERNTDILENLVSTKLLDLSVIYTIRLSEQDESMATVKVTKGLFDAWGLSFEELHLKALDNMKNDGYSAKDMAQVLSDMLGEEDFEQIMGYPGPKMMVLSNKSKMYAAAGVLDKEYMNKVTKGNEYIILPSSVHEVILLPAEEGMDTESLNAIIKEVNESQVVPNEILSDHAYLWSDNRLQMCA